MTRPRTIFRDAPVLQVPDVLVHMPEAQRLGGIGDVGGLAAVAGAGLRLLPRGRSKGAVDVRPRFVAEWARRGRAPVCRAPVAGTLQPRFLPEREACGLAAVVGGPVAADLLEVHGVVHAPHDAIAGTRLVGPVRDRQGPATVLEHLGHEGKPVEHAAVVERGEDLRSASDSDKLAWLQAECLYRGIAGESSEAVPTTGKRGAAR